MISSCYKSGSHTTPASSIREQLHPVGRAVHLDGGGADARVAAGEDIGAVAGRGEPRTHDLVRARLAGGDILTGAPIGNAALAQRRDERAAARPSVRKAARDLLRPDSRRTRKSAVRFE